MGEHQTPQLPEIATIWQQTMNWQPDSEQQRQFQQLYELILVGNRQLNLTRITDPQEFWEKHLWDSLRGVLPLWMDENLEMGNEAEAVQVQLGSARLKGKSRATSSVVDIGTGAGFPGVPVAIACPTWTVTLLDSTRKKMTFLENVVSELQIQNAKVLVDRVEQIGQSSLHRGAYDVALVRAVGPASVCAEYALPLLAADGLAVLYRGQWTDAEAKTLEAALEQLGGRVESVEVFNTPLTQGVRHCLYLRKIAPTSQEFPRAAGVPAKQPL